MRRQVIGIRGVLKGWDVGRGAIPRAHVVETGARSCPPCRIETEGRVRIRYYPGGVMGDANAIFRRMRLQQLNGGAFTLGDLVGLSGSVNLYSLPFVFDGVGVVGGDFCNGLAPQARDFENICFVH